MTLGSRLGRGLCSRAGPQFTISAISDISSVTSPEHRGDVLTVQRHSQKDKRVTLLLALDQFEANGTK